MDKVGELLADLADEHAALAEVVDRLTAEDWTLPTPAEGWSVADEISHLTYFDETAAVALRDPDRFAAHKEELFAGRAGPAPDVELGRRVAGAELATRWAEGRAGLLAAGAAADPFARVPWYGPSMSLASFLSARLMETWAHGQDVRDALGAPCSVSDRLRHLCHLGTAARTYTYLVHGVEDPGTPVRVVAHAPDGSRWVFGPPEAAEEITGSALGLALVFTQRRHPADTDVVAHGATAAQWLAIAQAFAGPAGPGREPGRPVPGLVRS